MTPQGLLTRSRAAGLKVTPTTAGRVKVSGCPAVVDAWLPPLQAHKASIARCLRADAMPRSWDCAHFLP